MKRIFALFLLTLLSAFVLPASAQDAPALPEPERIELTAADSAVLVGDFYASTMGQQPAILLMHINGGRRQNWSDWIDPLHAAGYNVLTVDLRGHGDSARPVNWGTAQNDTQEWLAWLGEQPTVMADRLGIIGGSIGSNLALVGCAQSEACVSVVALSPGMNYFGVEPQESVENMARRWVMLVAAQNDTTSAIAVLALEAAASRRTQTGLFLFPGSAHGTSLILTEPPLTPLLMDWLENTLAIES